MARLTSDQILELQQFLSQRGFHCSCNGVLTGSTRQAWIKFNSDNGNRYPPIDELTVVPTL